MAGTPEGPGTNCPACNAHNPPDAAKCRRCGTAIMDLKPPEPAEAPKTSSDPNVDYNRPVFGAPPALGPSRAEPKTGFRASAEPVQKSSVSILAGALIAIGGVVSALVGVIYLVASGMMPQMGLGTGLTVAVGVCGGIELAFGVVAILGGIFAVLRKKFAMAVVGSIFCILSVGFFYISCILGLIGLILLVISKEDFD